MLSRKLRLALLVSNLVLSTVVACSTSSVDHDADLQEADAAPMLPGGTVGGQVSYAGSELGRLSIVLFDSLPASGPPAYFVRVDAPIFPQSFLIEDVADGHYEVVIVLDVGANNPTQPGPEDLQKEAGGIDVHANLGAWITTSL